MSLESRSLLREGISYFQRAVKSHDMVTEVYIDDICYYKAIATIQRKYGIEDLKAYIADVYILTASDVAEVMERYPDIDCIVVISNWNQYTDLAKENAKMLGVGVFTLKQFLAALNYEGRKFLDTGIAKAVEEEY